MSPDRQFTYSNEDLALCFDTKQNRIRSHKSRLKLVEGEDYIVNSQREVRYSALGALKLAKKAKTQAALNMVPSLEKKVQDAGTKSPTHRWPDWQIISLLQDQVKMDAEAFLSISKGLKEIQEILERVTATPIHKDFSDPQQCQQRSASEDPEIHL